MEKAYIGSSVNLRRRFFLYYNIKGLQKKNRIMISKALRKYKHLNFSLEILVYCGPDKCIEKEQYFMDLLKPAYNICRTAGIHWVVNTHLRL